MIQVIEKTFRILERAGVDSGAALADIAEITKINKGTACNILKTLVSLGYVEKTRAGHYRISEKFSALGRMAGKEDSIRALCSKFAAKLAEQTCESGVVTTLRENKPCILAQVQHQRRVMVSISNYRDLSLYHSVSGRILLSFIDRDRLSSIAASEGFPGGEWDRINSMKALLRATAAIRSEGFSVMENADDEISAYAMPVFDSDGKICAAIGLSIPIFRLDRNNRRKILEALRCNAVLMSEAVAANGFKQDDFIFLKNADNKRK